MARRNNNQAADFANTFGLFYKGARGVMQDREMDKVNDAKVETAQGYSTEDVAQQEAMRNAINPETGKSYYDISDDGQGGLKTTNNFSYQNPEGQTVAPGSNTALEKREVHKFLGKQFDTAPDERTVRGMRGRAMADVVGKYDAKEGLKMQREMDADDRSVEEHGWKQGDRARVDKERGIADTVNASVEALANKLLVDPETGQRREPTPQDTMQLTQHHAAALMANGDSKGGVAAYREMSKMAMEQIQLQAAEREQLIGPAVMGIGAGDFTMATRLFNDYVPGDGNIPKGGIVVDPNSGAITVNRVTADGTKLPPHEFKSAAELAAAVRSMTDPKAMLEYTQTSIANDINSQKLALEKERVGLERERVGISRTEAANRTKDRNDPHSTQMDGEGRTLMYDKGGKFLGYRLDGEGKPSVGRADFSTREAAYVKNLSEEARSLEANGDTAGAARIRKQIAGMTDTGRAPARQTPNAQHIELLKKSGNDPAVRAQFEAKFGDATPYLGGSAPTQEAPQPARGLNVDMRQPATEEWGDPRWTPAQRERAEGLRTRKEREAEQAAKLAERKEEARQRMLTTQRRVAENNN